MGPSDWVAGWARIKPSEPAVVFEGRPTTWRELDAQASWTADRLAALGVRPGDRVACLMDNRTEFVTVFLGALRAGGTFVPLNALASAGELTALVNDCDARVVVTDDSYADAVSAMSSAGATATFASVDGSLPGDHVVLSPAPVEWTGHPGLARTATDPMCIYYTSGTTGHPKGAVISYSNVHFATLNWLIDLGFWQDDRFLLNLPLCFTGAMAILAPALHAGIAVYLERGFDAGQTLELIESHRITFMVAVPTMAVAMMRHADFKTRDLSSVRMILCGAAPVPMSVFETWTERGISFISSFGMTEVAGGFALITPVAEAAQRLGTAGRPCLYTEARIARLDGTDAPDGEVGELLLRGPLIFQGYWNNEAETHATIVNGWLHTGDMAVREASGYYRVVDRKKDSIITGGLNVYPAEVENALITLEGVLDCAVFGVPDDTWGEAVSASVVIAPGSVADPDAVRAQLRELIAAYKIPKHIEFVDVLPRTTSGKVLRRELRKRLVKQLESETTTAPHSTS
ncbi:class I adenylate-forming enzyme family protein [Streptomyces sp. NPDC002758]